LFSLLNLLSLCLLSNAQRKKVDTLSSLVPALNSALFNSINFRSVGPALTSGRIVDFAVNPKNKYEYFIATASGGVWKTNNAGISFQPLFDNEASFSIGCVVLDPKNPNIVWVGTGENNNQRSVGYGNGIYKSEDGGKSWKNMGLKNSEHIGEISIDHDNSQVVYVAAYGPLWKSGGERGVYKTVDGGLNWKQILNISDNTGFNEVKIEPGNSSVLYAAAHQRQRKVFTYIGGGPESALYKSTDAGATWKKIMNGLPSQTDVGRISIAISPVDSSTLYTIVEAGEGKGGIFMSKDKGASWQKRNSFFTAGNYYQEIFCDPKNIDKIFIMDSYIKYSVDGGKTLTNLPEKNKHVDNHAIWVDPDNTTHLLVGCDGGIYETFDNAENWNYKQNLPITQFYKVALDNAFPFYNIYGGTQDNFSLGGPSRTLSANGITNNDWFITQGGDGFETQVDYTNPNIIYAQSQYGGLSKFNKLTGEGLDIRPVEGEKDKPYRWNWDAPLLISKHNHNRLYFASNKVFKTDDQGNTWDTISGDLSRGLDRNSLKVMDKVWSIDAIAKNSSTDVFGQVTTLAESPLDENILFAGTDDGLIYSTTNGGKRWEKYDDIKGLPAQTYVNQVVASAHNKSIAYAAINHHRYGDFKPYLIKTVDGGKTWTSIAGNLPERGTVYCIAEDFKDPDSLFAGTEFGVFVAIDGGKNWIQLKGGLPTISVKDMEIQQREEDLVLATFGRGFYILEDYGFLRDINPELIKKAAVIFPVKPTWEYLQTSALGGSDKGFQGESFFTSPNPKPGAVFTYFLKENIKSLRELRQEREAERTKKGLPAFYPSLDSLRLEENQQNAYLLFTIKDEEGNVIRRLQASAKNGLNRLSWDFRTDGKLPVNVNAGYNAGDQGIFVPPGNYTVSLSKYEDGTFIQLVSPVKFIVKSLVLDSLSVADKVKLFAFGKKALELRRAATAVSAIKQEQENKLKAIGMAILQTPNLDQSLTKKVLDLRNELSNINTIINGDTVLQKREFETPTSIQSRIGTITESLISTTSMPTSTSLNSYKIASQQFQSVLTQIKQIQTEISKIENVLEENKAPYTPGRMPDWKPE
ncbi:MAG: hypothetical protein ABIR81_04735, partial [Ginsengibacter sp.]